MDLYRVKEWKQKSTVMYVVREIVLRTGGANYSGTYFLAFSSLCSTLEEKNKVYAPMGSSSLLYSLMSKDIVDYTRYLTMYI